MIESKILNQIKNYNKPINLEKYINLCLFGKDGYYKNFNIIGKSGDFITSPEISQLFGEIIGLYVVDYWQNFIKKPFNLIELGPGKGTLLLDILNITNKFENIRKSMSLNLVEQNINLINIQKFNFKKKQIDIKKFKWTKNFNIKNNKPIFIISNEFFDCFPVRQFFKKKTSWFEKMIEYKKITNDIGFKDIIVKNSNDLSKIKYCEANNILELSSARDEYFLKICKHLKKVGGIIFTIDYGYYEKPSNFTLQSIKNNKKTNILSNLGSQDITALVDFKNLIKIAENQDLKVNIFSTQRDFFIKYGVIERLKKITKNIPTMQKKIINEGLERIIDKDGMGTLFKILIISK